MGTVWDGAGAAAGQCHEAQKGGQMEPGVSRVGVERSRSGEDKCFSFPFTLGPAERASLAAISTIETVIMS